MVFIKKANLCTKGKKVFIYMNTSNGIGLLFKIMNKNVHYQRS
jgi:hypothetical protein